MKYKPLVEKKFDNAVVKVFKQEEMGLAAAEFAAEAICDASEKKGASNLLFSTGASQFGFVSGLQSQPEISWDKVHAFHLDEYKDMSEGHPASFRLWLKERIINVFNPASFELIEGDAPDIEQEIKRYSKLIEDNPIDVGFIGIGENGHIAFNDPPVADFQDPKLVKIVQLDEGCRKQQLGEGWFATLDEVPKEAISLTVPAILRCKKIISVVPDSRKADAIKAALEGEISTSCPASILRTHDDVTIFLDEESAAKLDIL